MKRVLFKIVTSVLLLSVSLIVAEHIPMENLATMNSDHQTKFRCIRNETPEYSFHIDPLRIGASWYDYFPGGEHSIPIRLQPCPSGIFPGGGIYTAFQGMSSAGGLKRVYYGYIEEETVLMGPSLINLTGTTAELSVSIDVDNETGVPFVVWCSPDGCFMSFDQYNMIGIPGLWITPYQVQPEGYRPEVFVGGSPNQGQRRLYIWGFGTNDIIISYTDFYDPIDLESYNPDDWSIVTVPHISNWYADDIIIYASPIVSRESGTIALVGHSEYLDTAYPYHSFNALFVLENNNYGEGNWNLFTGDPTIPIENPEEYFVNENLQPFQDMRYRAFRNRHNTILDDEGNYHFGCVYALFTENNSWFPSMTTSKHVKFDRETEEFIVQDLYPREYSGLSYLPWSIPPEYDNGGNLIYDYSWPCYWPEPNHLHLENYHRMIEQEGRLIVLFQTSSEETLPVTQIMISNDYGDTWSYPIILDSVEIAELEEMIPTYWYIADCMEYLGNDWYRIYLFFFDQNDYGSFVLGNGPNTGGYLCYTSIDIEFDYDPPPDPPLGLDDHLVIVPESLLEQNYPNPFNPETTIRYRLPVASQVRLEIYNLRGELIKTIVDEYKSAGEYMAVWNGNNRDNRRVASGIYLYRLTIGNQSETRKMLLLK